MTSGEWGGLKSRERWYSVNMISVVEHCTIHRATVASNLIRTSENQQLKQSP
jgi:hypothetical protein